MFSRAVVATILAVPFFARTAFAATCAREYTVKEGDYCDLISAANSVSTYQLAAVNPEINEECNNLMPGQVLCLGTEDEFCSQVHVVQLGDTCDLLVNSYHINSTLLLHNNPQIQQDCTDLYTGEVVCVAGTSYDPAPADGTPSASSVSHVVTSSASSVSHIVTLSAPPISAVRTSSPSSTSAAAPSPTHTANEDDEEDECDEEPTSGASVPTTPAHVATSASSTPTPANDDDDDDCDEDEESTSASSVPTTPAHVATSASSTPTPANNDDDDEEDCDEASTSSASVSVTTSHATASHVTVPVPTSSVSTSHVITSAPSSTTTSSNNDDDDLPECSDEDED